MRVVYPPALVAFRGILEDAVATRITSTEEDERLLALMKPLSDVEWAEGAWTDFMGSPDSVAARAVVSDVSTPPTGSKWHATCAIMYRYRFVDSCVMCRVMMVVLTTYSLSQQKHQSLVFNRVENATLHQSPLTWLKHVTD